MVKSSLQPARGLAEGRFSRQKQVQETIGEARTALRASSGLLTPAPLPRLARVRRWAVSCMAGLTRPRRQPRPGRRFRLGAHISTLTVLLLLAVAVIAQVLGISIAYGAVTTGSAGGAPILSRGPETTAQVQAFAFAAVPITVTRRRAATEAEISPAGTENPSSENLAARNEVVTCTVQAGDTLAGIAEQYGIAPYTLYWVNDLPWPGKLQAGMVLTVPPISGVPHTVQAGETLESIADMYGVRAGNIVGYPPNGLRYPYHLEAGQEIFVPGGIVEIPEERLADGDRPPPTIVKMPGGEKLSWPTTGEITAPFGWSRAYGGYHKGMDIANSWGTPIYAAAAGKVIASGWGGLGWYVVIDHENGFSTEYGHMADRPLVAEGEMVKRGQQIGLMGSTYGAGGYATGDHLHFAVRHHGVLIDPLPLLEQ